MKNIGTCKLCFNYGALEKSHAYGRAVFRRLFKPGSGKAVAITYGTTPNKYSSDGWAEYQLCKCCEMLLNARYEDYSLGVLRAKYGTIEKSEFGLSFTGIDQHKLIMYFLSIYWRAANSSHRAYKHVELNCPDNEYFRRVILNDLAVPPRKLSVKVSRLKNYTKVKGLSEQGIKEWLLSPFPQTYTNDSRSAGTICFVFEGFLIEIYLNGLNIKRRQEPGVLSKKRKRLIIQYLDLFKVSHIVNMIAAGYEKEIKGNSRVNV